MRRVLQLPTPCLLLMLAFLTGCHSLGGNHSVYDTLPGCSAPVCDASGDFSCDSSCDSQGCDGAGYASGSVRVVRGRSIPLLDRTASLIGTVNKVALWDHRADNHSISPTTERMVASYLQSNGLNDTLVRSNQYDPVGEWQRLARNKKIAAPLRFTVGAYDVLKYTLVPGRLVGGDWYNPFTNSVHLYSDIPAIGLSKAAYAKDVYSRKRPGAYASSQDLPLFGIYHETLANREVISFMRARGGPGAAQEAERLLYPDLAGSLGAQTLGFLPYGSVYGRAAGAVVGHAARAAKNQVTNLR